jgi:pimeloyl-ACP methyl ester carboxylesterase
MTVQDPSGGMGGERAWAPPGFLPPERHGTIRDRIEAGTHFRVEGDGPAVVLIHGVGLDLEMWQAQVAALRGRFTIVRFDLLGHGASAKPPGALRLKSFVAQLAMLFDYLRLQQAVVVGFSLGALIAQSHALAHGERLAGLVLLNGVYDRPPEARRDVLARLRQAEIDGPDSIIDAALARWFTPAFAASAPDTVARIRDRLTANDRHGFLSAYRVFAEADAELAGRLGAIACPTLVATGADDPRSTPAMARAMATAIPHAEVRILPGLRHLAPVEGAATVNQMLGDFLDRLERHR